MVKTIERYIKKHVDKIEEPKVHRVPYVVLAAYYDPKRQICVKRVRIGAELVVGSLYDITNGANDADDADDADTYTYVILKKHAQDVYYIAEYYEKICTVSEEYLGDEWIYCDIPKQFGIDIDNFKVNVSNTENVYTAYWVSAIIFDEGDTKPWLCTITTAQDTLEQAKVHIQTLCKNHTVLDAWVDVVDDKDNTTVVYHECFMYDT